MNIFARPIIVTAALALISALPASANFSGEYTVRIFLGPTHEHTVSRCIIFTNTGGIAGFVDSGTWISRDDNTWGGNFVVDGNVLRWYGTELGGSEVTNFYNRITNGVPGEGGFDDWAASAPPITAFGDGMNRLVPGCKPSGKRS